VTAQEISCREALDFLAAYLDGELTTGVRETFERHLARCPACVEYLESYRETIRLGREARDLDDAAPEEVPEELIEAILASKRSA
jgi:anti-sigma factor (TIGR02949 family)